MEHFTSKDKQQIESHRLSLEKVYQDLDTFKKGIPFTKLVQPATIGNGIRKLTDSELDYYSGKYEEESLDVVKFVPASGAATRMFKDLLAFLNTLNGVAEDDEEEQRKQFYKAQTEAVKTFFDHLPAFAFYDKLVAETKMHYPDFDRLSTERKKYSLAKTLLDKDKLNFSNLPKGLVPFHNYADETRTAFEEHFVEAESYSTKNGLGKLHFTVAETHLKEFENELEYIRKKYGRKEETKNFEVDFSFQSKGSDTIAVDMENIPFRDENEHLVFRPSGHGALLENLNQIDADIIFIKNIDNVSVENNLSLVSIYKKALAGILLEIQEETYGFLEDLQGFQNLVGLSGKSSVSTRSKKDLAGEAEETIQQAKTFLKEKLNVFDEPQTLSELKNLLDRPIRICGMVQNTGDPGGGPFWMKAKDEVVSLQIVEMAQVDLGDPQQHEILKKATHFNPVDLVCGVKNFKGEKFDLSQFSNPENGFISNKSMNGRALKALELPGLWNGAMEHWNTIFVEVPLETFNPVKTVIDLLKSKHQ